MPKLDYASAEALEGLWGSSETADYLGVPPSTLYQWAYRGVGPRSYKIGRHRKYRSAEVMAWVDDQADRPRAVSGA
jgi:excisionase family DNA binding protein